MACRKPGVRVPMYLPDGKHHLKGIGEVTVKSYGACLFGYRAEMVRNMQLYPYDDIPCGDCDGCRLRLRREKTYRLMAEAESHQDVWFVTLTYRDEDLTPSHRIVADPGTGELHIVNQLSDSRGNRYPCATLVYDEFAAFEKRLRRRIEYLFGSDVAAFRQYHCGEYGSIGKRPHFHAILFGIPELVLLCKQNKPLRLAGHPGMYRSFLLEECWGHGYVSYAKANFDTMQYVAGYTLKKMALWHQRSDAELWYAAQGLTPEEMPRHLYRGKMVLDYPAELVAPEKGSGSNRPGLGREFYETHKDEIYTDYLDEMIIRGPKGPLKIRPAKYFDALYDIDHPDFMQRLKQRRKKSAEDAQVVRIRERFPAAPDVSSSDWRTFKIAAERLLRYDDILRDSDGFKRSMRCWKDI